VETPKAVAEKEEAPEGFRRDIFYSRAGVHQIPKEEMKKVKEVADYMKENPQTTVTITGYADRSTGSAKVNDAISKRRANAVRSALIMNYKINAKRIKVDAKGSQEQPFAKDTNKAVNKNRVAIAIVE
jgi:outer membrane protein OmpA-like peptidoglycan-associated protein